MKYLVRFKHLFLDHLRWFYYLTTNARHMMNMSRFRASTHVKPKKQIQAELKALQEYWGCIPMQYYTHDFYSQDCDCSIEDMKKYIPGYYFYYVIFPQYDDVKKITRLIENKISMNVLFLKLGLPQPDIIFIKQSSVVSTFGGFVLGQSDIASILNSCNSKKLFIKPVCGRGGKGILIAKRQLSGHFTVNNNLVDAEFIKSLSGDFVFEAFIQQSDFLMQVYPHSVNTLRAVTKRDITGTVSLIGVTLRMGIAGSEIDNGSAGGISIGLDIESGLPLRPYASYEFGMQRFYTHPDSGFCFAALKIPNWSAVKTSIIESATALDHINLVGWDIAITDAGIVIIEVNTMFGLDHMQSAMGGLESFFVSGNPKEQLYQ